MQCPDLNLYNIADFHVNRATSTVLLVAAFTCPSTVRHIPCQLALIMAHTRCGKKLSSGTPYCSGSATYSATTGRLAPTGYLPSPVSLSFKPDSLASIPGTLHIAPHLTSLASPYTSQTVFTAKCVLCSVLIGMMLTPIQDGLLVVDDATGHCLDAVPLPASSSSSASSVSASVTGSGWESSSYSTCVQSPLVIKPWQLSHISQGYR